jgi:hypothetical protein
MPVRTQQRENQNRLLPQKSKAAAPVQTKVSEIRFSGLHIQATGNQKAGQAKALFFACHQLKKHKQDKQRIVQNEDTPLGAFSIDKNCRTVKAENQRVDKLLWKISNVGDAKTIQGAAPEANQMGKQQIPQVQAQTLVQCLQILTGNYKTISEFI